MIPLIAAALLFPRGELVAQSGVAPDSIGIEGFRLEPASPNPFDEETRIRFFLDDVLFDQADEVRVSMTVYNILHQVVAVPRVLDRRGRAGERLDDLALSAGYYTAYWDGLDLEGQRATSGPYFIELIVRGASQVRKVLLVR